MGELTEDQKNFDVTKFFGPDADPGEPVFKQVRDPFTGSVHGPGLEVTLDGEVRRHDRGTGDEE